MSVKQAAYFNVGDVVLHGRFYNKPARIVEFGDDGKGNPTVTLEPIKGGKPRTMALFKIRRKTAGLVVLAARVALRHERAATPPV